MNAIQISAPSERVYTSDEVALDKKLHPSMVRKLFVDEPGVIRIGHAGRHGRRQYFCLRIPESVVKRVFGRMTVKGTAA